MNKAFYDIETASLDFNSQLWCLALAINDDEPEVYSDVSLEFKPLYEAFLLMSRADELWGWNNLGFDSIVLNTQFGFTHKNERDGLLLARLIWSADELIANDRDELSKELLGSYSLEAFGQRINYPKKEHTDFTKLTSEMVDYCKQDVNLTRVLINEYILTADYQPPANVVGLEEETAKIIASQQIYGWDVDIPAMRSLKLSFEKQMFKLRTDLRKVFKPKFLADGKVKVPKKLGITREFHTKIVDNFTESETDEL